MFGKKKERNRGPSFQRNAEYSQLPEEIKREMVKGDRSEKMAISARLSSDAEIEGTIKFDGIMRIDGRVHGEIITDSGELVVSDSGIVNATITTKSAVIEGRVDGKIIASDRVVLKRKAHLTGDLQASILVIEEGVVFVGQCNVIPEGMKLKNIVKNDQPKTDQNQQKSFSTNEGDTANSTR